MHEGTEQYMSVDAIYWHEGYDYQTLDNDIMLMKLAHTVYVNQYVKPVALPKACPMPGDMCTVSGWGNIYSDEGELQLNLTLKVIKTCDFLIKEYILHDVAYYVLILMTHMILMTNISFHHV